MPTPSLKENNNKNKKIDVDWNETETQNDYIGCTRIKKIDGVYPYVTNWKSLNSKDTN